MAVTITTSLDGLHVRSFDVEATADADVAAAIAHGLPDVPAVVLITPLQQAEALLLGWAVTGITDTTITLTASAAVGSGAAGAQLRVTVIEANAPIFG